MREHRRARIRVNERTQDSNVDAGTALENLRAEVVDIEALARPAEAAADALPRPPPLASACCWGRIQSLVTRTSEQASASLRFATRRSRRSRRSWRHAGEQADHDRVTLRIGLRRACPCPEIRNESK